MAARGYEVLFLYAHMDEFVMQHIGRHSGRGLRSFTLELNLSISRTRS
jgi:hypothetical protein